MDAVNDPANRRIVVMKSAQVGYTEILLNIIGYYIHQDPSPILVIQPNQTPMAEAFSKDRIAPMIRDTPALHGLIADPKARSSGNTILHKTFPGGHLTIVGANSPASLASRPIRILAIDEPDRYPPSAGTEGDSISLGEKRTKTFFNRRIIMGGTPTIKGASRIEYAFEQSDKRYYLVPCPHCGEFHRLTWQGITWPKDDPNHVQHACPHCGGLAEESHKGAMIAAGRWEATEPFKGIAGFHINELYSPWVRWRDVVRDFLESKDSPELLKTWTNTSLGETFEDAGEGVDPNSLMARREEYDAEVPQAVSILTAGADVQADRIEVEVVGWTQTEESYGIANYTIWGDPKEAQPWEELDALLLRQYTHASGHDIPIACVCIDEGYLTDMVRSFVKPRIGRRIFAVKGEEGASRPVISTPKKTKQSEGGSVKRWIIGTDQAKGIIYGRLNRTDPGPGYCHFPMSYDEEYFLQLTAEKQRTTFIRGFPKIQWIKTRPRNEALDKRVYAFAALRIANPDYKSLRNRLDTPKAVHAQTPKQTPPKPKQNGKFKRHGL